MTKPETTKYDQGKTDWAILPYTSLEAVVRIMKFGEKKYGRGNWAVGTTWLRYWNAAMRHMVSWLSGEDKDPETGESHLAHAACCVLFLLHYVESDTGEDDRAKDFEAT